MPREARWHRWLTEGMGWAGAGLIVLAYALVSFGIIGSGSAAYQVLNGVGAVGVLVISAIKRTYQPAVLNLFWALIAAVALIRLIV